MPNVPVQQPDGSIVYMSLEELERHHGNEEQAHGEETVSMVGPQEIDTDAPNGEHKTKRRVVLNPSNANNASTAQRKTILFPASAAIEASVPVLSTAKQISTDSSADESDASGMTSLSLSTPVDDYFVDLARAKEWDTRDHVSPLEERIESHEVTRPVSDTTPRPRYDDVAAVAQSLSFGIPPGLENRLHSLIQSRIKDVRSDSQLIDYAMRAPEHGGLGISGAQAHELVGSIHKTQTVSADAGIPAPRKTVLPKKAIDPVTQSTTKQAPMEMPANRSFTDIHAPEVRAREAMGPIEEIGNMTLVDFRRYSTDPAKAVGIMTHKIQSIREESYLEYQKVKRAWTESPLYRQYLGAIAQSLDSGTPLSTVEVDLSALDMAEIAKFSTMLRM